MNPDKEVNSTQVSDLLHRQLKVWPLAQQNFKRLELIRTKVFEMGGFIIKAQYTPSRLISSDAKIDIKSLSERPCFLCSSNLPVEQEKINFTNRYFILCNPYPIFTEHFTIASTTHEDQSILHHFTDFLQLIKSLNKFTLFYNGPKSGASAPDHAHFQAVTSQIMPLDYEWEKQLNTNKACIFQDRNGQIYTLTNFLRNGFIIKASTPESATKLFHTVYQALEIKPGEIEPGMNLFGKYIDNLWVIILIPRKQHRPKQFFAEGKKQILSSPGGADIGGLFITAREEDFNKITTEILCDIYKQICLSDEDIEKVAFRIMKSTNTSEKKQTK